MCDKEAESLLVPNPLLQNGSEKYIWISDSEKDHRNAQMIFDYLLKQNIYVNGFVSNISILTSLKMYNKQIYDLTEVRFGSEVYYDKEVPSVYRGVNWTKAKVLNPNLNKEKIVIWGAGITGENVYRILLKNGITASCFIDSNKSLEGTIKCGLPVYTPDRFNFFSENITIIESMKSWKTLDMELKKFCHNRFYYCLDDEGYNICDSVFCAVSGQKKNLFCLTNYWMFNRFEGKKVYIYGTGIIEKEFAKYLKLMDYDFACFLVDELEEEDDGNKENYKYIEEILYEDGYYIWVYDRKKSKRLKELGLQYFDGYECNNYLYDITIERKDQLDINLGHNYLADSPYQGYVIYGEETPDNYKIVVLGGSTTDGAMYPFKSWAECLYEELGSGITIYNGGVKGYTSGQEMIKFIRDVLTLKPNMVIVYDGANEHNTDLNYPLAFRYVGTVFDFAKSHIEDDVFLGNDDKRVCYGVKSQNNLFDNWLSNMRNMYAIANERGIAFLSFCQPVLYSKKRKSLREKNILLSMYNRSISNDMKGSFRECIRQKKDLPEYIYDLSHIFDGKSDVYMDWCHVWEKGNRIIAEEIKKIILPRINVK